MPNAREKPRDEQTGRYAARSNLTCYAAPSSQASPDLPKTNDVEHAEYQADCRSDEPKR